MLFMLTFLVLCFCFIFLYPYIHDTVRLSLNLAYLWPSLHKQKYQKNAKISILDDIYSSYPSLEIFQILYLLDSRRRLRPSESGIFCDQMRDFSAPGFIAEHSSAFHIFCITDTTIYDMPALRICDLTSNFTSLVENNKHFLFVKFFGFTH